MVKRLLFVMALLAAFCANAEDEISACYAFSTHPCNITWTNSAPNIGPQVYAFSTYSDYTRGYALNGQNYGLTRFTMGTGYRLVADQPRDEKGPVTRRFLGWYTKKDGRWTGPNSFPTVDDVADQLTGELGVDWLDIDSDAGLYNTVPVVIAKYISLWDVETAVTPSGAGTVSGSGRFDDGSHVTLEATPASGYSFEKWSDNVTDNPRTIESVSASATYTAVFTGNVYTVTFHPAGGAGETPAVEARFASEMPAIATFPKWYGYEFDGYFDQQDGKGTRYYNADGSSAHAWDKTTPTTLFAGWRALDAELRVVFTEHVTVIWHRVGESSTWIKSTESTTYRYPTGTKYEAYAETEEGWRADYPQTSTKKGTVDYQAVEFRPVASEETVYYRVVFHDPSGTFDDETYPAVRKGTVATPPDNWSRPGYTLSWDPEIGPLSANTTYNAVWTPQLYEVAFAANGGSGTMTNVFFLRDTLCTLPSNRYVRTGHQFAGWTTNGVPAFADGATNALNLAAVGETCELAAAWTANRYTVAFDPNPPAGETVTGTMEPQAFVYDVSQALSGNQFACGELWAFGGWRDALNGKTYTNCETVVNLCAVPDGTNRLEAIWKSAAGDLSVAMMGEGANLRWVDEGNGWVARTDRAGNPCGAHVGEQAAGATMTANVHTGGTLSFHWAPYVEGEDEGYEKLVVTIDGVEVKESPYKNEQDIQIDVPEGSSEISINNFNAASAWGGATACESYITGMTWTPTGSKPQQGDPVAPTAAGVEGAVFSLTIPTTSGVSYGVWTNADLSVPAADWGLWETKPGDGQPWTPTWTILPETPQLFFRAFKVK